MAAILLPNGKQDYQTATGEPLVGGKLRTFDAGTNNPRPTFMDAAANDPNTNPVVLDGRGEAVIFWRGAYKVELLDANDVVIWTVDGIQGVDVNEAVEIAIDEFRDELADTTDPSNGAALVAYTQALAYTNGTVGSRLLQDVTVLDLKYMTKAQMDAVRSYAGADVTAAIQAALDDISNTVFIPVPGGTVAEIQAANYYKGGGKLYLPPGKYIISDTLRVGNGTEIFGAAIRGFTYGGVVTNTGTVIECNMPGDKRKWAFSSATYDTATGNFYPFNGNVNVAGGPSVTVCQGINIHDLFIDGDGCYGGVRLVHGSAFNLQQLMVVNTGVGYCLQACYGGHYDNLMGNTNLYGMVLLNCTAMVAGNIYVSRGGGGGWDVLAITDPTVRFISPNMTTGAVPGSDPGGYLPADWQGKTYGIYAHLCWGGMDFVSQTVERWDIGAALDNVHNFTLTGYAELNIESNYVFVNSEGNATVFANSVTPTYIPGSPPAPVPFQKQYRYHFGFRNRVSLNDCTVGPIYIGNVPDTRVHVRGSSPYGAGIDWTYSDAIFYEDLLNDIRVASDGAPESVNFYTTLDEALRRIEVGNNASNFLDRRRRAWRILIRSGDTLHLTQNHSLADNEIIFAIESGSTNATIVVDAPSAGNIFRLDLSGDMSFTFNLVNITFPAAAAAAGGGDAGLFLLINSATNLRLAMRQSSVNLGGGYSLIQVNGGAARVDASWYTGAITAAIPSPILANYTGGGVTGSSLVASIQKGTVVDAAIKALGTNGWQSTVLSSNF